MGFPGSGSPFVLLRYRQVQQGQYHLVDFVVVVVHLHTPAEHDGSAGLEIGQSGKASAVCVLKMGPSVRPLGPVPILVNNRVGRILWVPKDLGAAPRLLTVRPNGADHQWKE